jgi:hypothetical protein
MSDTTERQCYISIIGSRRHVAEALYIASLPRSIPEYGHVISAVTQYGDTLIPAALTFEEADLAPANHALFSLSSIVPQPPYGAATFKEKRWGASHAKHPDRTFVLDAPAAYTLSDGSTAMTTRAHLALKYFVYQDGLPKAALLTLSKRCPHVLITCFSHPPTAHLDLQAAGFFGGKTLKRALPGTDFPTEYSGLNLTISAATPSNDQNTDSARKIERMVFAQRATGQTALWRDEVFSKRVSTPEGSYVSALRVTWRPALNSANIGGPDSLARLVQSFGRTLEGDGPQESASRFFIRCRTPSGYGLLDAALSSPVKKFGRDGCNKIWQQAFSPMFTSHGHVEDLENDAHRIQPEKIARLAALCADDQPLARVIGSDAGLLANGVHIIAFMARLARPNTLESAGVKNILSQATFTLPSPEHSQPPSTKSKIRAPWKGKLDQIGPLQTVYTLAASGNEHAWTFLLDKTDKGFLKGFDSDFLAACVQHTKDLPLWLSKHGTVEVRRLVNKARGRFHTGVLEEFELVERATALMHNLAPTPAPPQPNNSPKQPAGASQ